MPIDKSIKEWYNKDVNRRTKKIFNLKLKKEEKLNKVKRF